MFELEGIINQQLLAVRTQFYTVLLAKEQIKRAGGERATCSSSS